MPEKTRAKTGLTTGGIGNSKKETISDLLTTDLVNITSVRIMTALVYYLEIEHEQVGTASGQCCNCGEATDNIRVKFCKTCAVELAQEVLDKYPVEM